MIDLPLFDDEVVLLPPIGALVEGRTKCSICGHVDRRDEAKGSIPGLCYCCSFWIPFITNRDDPKYVRAGNVHYELGDEDELYYDLGRAYVFTFPDGHVVETRNVGCQGGIPSRFLRQLPNNAVLKVLYDHPRGAPRRAEVRPVGDVEVAVREDSPGEGAGEPAPRFESDL